MTQERLVVIGGFATGRGVLNRVADAACAIGLAGDADVFTFPEAMDDPNRVRRAVQDQFVVTHSAGALALGSHTKPCRIATWMGPEPRSPRQLNYAAAYRFAWEVARCGWGPDRAGHQAVVLSNIAETLARAKAHIQHIGSIGGFSTRRTLAAAQAAGIPVEAVAAFRDPFFPLDFSVAMPGDSPSARTVSPEGVPMQVVHGGHDVLLVRPQTMLQVLAE